MMSEQLSGIFLSFDESQCESIWDAVKAAGYSPDTDGLKSWILSKTTESPQERTSSDRVLEALEEYLRGHPEEVKRYALLGQAAIRDIFGRFVKR
jgi:cytochrome c-type biogenesis protein CcmH/NrfG